MSKDTHVKIHVLTHALVRIINVPTHFQKDQHTQNNY